MFHIYFSISSLHRAIVVPLFIGVLLLALPTPADSRSFKIAKTETAKGICLVRKGQINLDQMPCTMTRQTSVGMAEIRTFYQWPSGSKTVTVLKHKRLTINGQRAKKQKAPKGTTCLLNSGSGNVFCFSAAKKIAGATPPQKYNTPKSCHIKTRDGLTKGPLIDVKASTPPNTIVKAGEPVRISWALKSKIDYGCKTPFYLVFSMPEQVRFEGEGFLAFLPRSIGPYEIGYQKDRLRVFIPLHQERKLNKGSLKLKIFKAGSLKLDWALVELAKTRKYPKSRDDFLSNNPVVHKPAQSNFRFNVRPGKPHIIVQDRYSTDEPTTILQSLDDRYILKNYDGYYRVFDREKGTLLLERDGTKANFSPTGRFLTAIRGRGVEIFDLAVGQIAFKQIFDQAGTTDFFFSAIGWQHEDNYLVVSITNFHGNLITPTLIDGNVQRIGDTEAVPGQRRRPGHTQYVRVDKDNGNLIIHGRYGTISGNLMYTEMGDYARPLGVSISPEAERQKSGFKEINPPWKKYGWPLGDSFRLSHNFVNKKADSFIVKHKNLALEHLKIAANKRGENTAIRAAVSLVPNNDPDQAGGLFTQQHVRHSGYPIRADGSSYIRKTAIKKKRLGVSLSISIPRKIYQQLEQYDIHISPHHELQSLFTTDIARLEKVIGQIESGSALAKPINGHLPKEEKPVQLEIFKELKQHLIFDRDEAYNDVEEGRLIHFPNNISEQYKVQVANLVFSIVMRLKKSREIFRAPQSSEPLPENYYEKYIENPYECYGANGIGTIIRPWAVNDIWYKKLDDREIFVFQSACGGGLRLGWHLGQLTVLQVDKKGTVSFKHIGVSSKSTTNFLQAEDGSVHVNLINDKYLLFKGVNGAVLIYDLEQKKEIIRLTKANPFGLETAVLVSQDLNFVILYNKKGRLSVRSVKNNQEIISGYYLDDELIIYNNQGYYTSTPEGAHFVYLKFPGMKGYHAFHQFKKTLNRPDIIRTILQGRKDKFPAPKLSAPPSVDFTLKRGDKAQITAELASFTGLKTLRLFIDGRLAQEVEASGQTDSKSLPLSLPPEARWITVVAVDKNGFESVPKTVRLANKAGKPLGKLFALGVGTDKYDNPNISRLSLARADAKSFTKAVLASKGKYYSKVVTDKLLDAADLRRALKGKLSALIKRARPEDTIMLLIAGHGLRDKKGRFYLAGKNTRLDDIEGTAVSWTSLAKLLERAKAKVIVFLDACHAGAADERATNDDAAAAFLDREQSIAVIAASKGRQFSIEKEGLGGGVFTTSLRKILTQDRSTTDTNKNGVIELSELYGALKRRVVTLTKGKQTPWIARNQMVGEIPLF